VGRIRLRIEPPGAAPVRGEYDGPAVVLGRSGQATVPVPDASLSRLHARLFERDGGWWVEDLGSKNATLLNGQLLKHAMRLQARDRLQMAGTHVEVEASEDERGPSPAADDEPLTGIFKPAAALLDVRETTAPRALKLLNDVHRALARPITLEALAELILESAFTHLGPEEGALFLRRPNGQLYRAASRRLPGEGGEFVYSRRLIHEVADEGKAALVEDVSHDERFMGSESLMGFGVRSLLAAPLLDAEGSAGMLVLHSRATQRKFREEDLDLLVSLASAATLRLRTIVFAEEAAQRRLIDKELALAHDIQMGMLPRRFPERPEIDLAASLKPARSVGGDLYDFLLAGDRLWFLVGDVSGKGVAAALVMAMTRTLFHAVVPAEDELAGIAGRMNRELARDNERAMFVTAFLGCLDLAKGELEYVNAGHNPPYRLSAAEELSILSGARGLPLGVFDDRPYVAERVSLRPGDGLFVFTDGVIEATNNAGEDFGEPRLLDALRPLRGEASASHLVESTLDVLDDFVGAAPPADDVTVLALRWRK
jgi:sigma-B regulation protein RsbU (phosphoserine phosphatase)